MGNLKPLENIIRSASAMFEEEATSTFRAEGVLFDDGSLSEVIKEALLRWLRARVPDGLEAEERDAQTGRMAIEILGARNVSGLDDGVAITLLDQVTRDLQPELCKAILAIIDGSALSPTAAPSGQS